MVLSAGVSVGAVVSRRRSGLTALRRGRPARVPGEVASERRSCFLTPAEDAALLKEAAETHCTPAELIRDAVNAYVSDYSERKVFPTR